MTDEAKLILHPDDGDVVRWVDGALSPEERAALDAHAAECTECRLRRAKFERRSARFSQVLRDSDTPALVASLRFPVRHPAPVTRAGWRAAAVVVLSIGGAMAVTPVRAWVLSAAKAAWAKLSPVPAGSPTEPGAVSFVPTGATLAVRIPARHDARLTIEVVEGDRVTALGGTGSAVLVLPNEVRFADEAKSAVDYLVRVPLRIEVVSLSIGVANLRIFRPSAVGEKWIVPLDGDSAGP